MGGLRLRLLEWKIRARAWLEAVWESQRFGIALTILGTLASAIVVFRTQAPGVSVAAMGAAAALMAGRTKATGTEKATWMLIISCLLVGEVSAIRKDRAENDKKMVQLLEEERTARSEAKSNFEGIGNGINEQSRQSQTQFAQTIGQMSTQFNKTMGGMKSVLATAEGTKKDTGALLAQLQSAHADIQAMRSRRTSGNALIKMTSELTETLRDMHARWYDAINNLEHIEEEQTWYQFPPLSPERRKVVEQTFQERIDRAGTQMMNAQQIAAKNADDLRGILLSEIPKESRTQEDDKQAELFKHLDTASGYPNCCPDLEQAADYLDSLAQRAKAALGD